MAFDRWNKLVSDAKNGRFDIPNQDSKLTNKVKESEKHEINKKRVYR